MNNERIFWLLHFPFQTFAFLTFSMFVLKVLNIEKECNWFYKVNIWTIILSLFLIVFAFVLDSYTFQGLMRGVYLFFIFPIFSIYTIIAIPIILKTKSNIKYFLITGIFLLNTFTAILFVKSINNTIEESNKLLYLFFIGVLLENICFSLGIGYKQKLVFQERDSVNNKLISKLNEQIELEQQIRDLKLDTFRSQMNPHFIFNALNSIKLYITNNETREAAHYLTKFSKLIRKILEASNIKETSLKEELKTIELYMTIENIRLSNEIDFKIHTDNNVDLDTIKIPPLILQPFLENSIWHGLSSKKGSKKINVSITQTKKEIVEIQIQDNGIGRKASTEIKLKKAIKRKSLGINLTNERLKNFTISYKNDYSLQYIDLSNDNNCLGTIVLLKLPLF